MLFLASLMVALAGCGGPGVDHFKPAPKPPAHDHSGHDHDHDHAGHDHAGHDHGPVASKPPVSLAPPGSAATHDAPKELKAENASSPIAVLEVSKDKPLNVVCSFFPVALFTRNVIGDRPGVNVSILLDPKLGCPHDYDLKPSDRKRLADAHVFILNGGGMEEFVDDLRKANPKMQLLDTAEKIACMEGTCDHDHGDGHDHDHGVNPHFFSSPLMAARQVEVIVERLSKIDPAGAESYRKNGAAYRERLLALAEELKKGAAEIKSAQLITEHGIFDYFARDTGLTVAGYVRSSHAADPSAKEMKKLADLIRTKKIPAIFTEPQYSSKVAAAIAKETGAALLTLDPVASGPDNAPLDHYEKTMRTNLETLKKVFAKPSA
jgi:ABC-type Zn uptake system ZnuABC Zn-binding protein ZnuA